MRNLNLSVFFAVLISFLALPMGAVERSSQENVGNAKVAPRASLLRPNYLFNMRGRQDPFVDSSKWHGAGKKSFSISSLEFKGLLEVEGQVSALFTSLNDKAVYTLRGTQLFGISDKPVAGVSGRIVSAKEVRLRQGESTLNFSALRAPKRKL